MSELQEKIKSSIDRLKAFEPEEGYYLAFSGGKDSVIIKALAEMAGVKYDAHYRLTSVDPPELVHFIKDVHPDVDIDIPHYSNREFNHALRGQHITMWTLIPKKLMPPTRLARYCCRYLKESGGDGRMVMTGVRWAEGSNRKRNQGLVTVMSPKDDVKAELATDDFKLTKQGKGVVLTNDNDDSRRLIENCYKRSKTTINPIIDWTDEECWEFINGYGIPVCSLYGEGWNRLGCIGCPMSRTAGREKAFARWPKYKAAYLRSFKKMLAERERKGRLTPDSKMGATVESVWNWWMEYKDPVKLTADEIEELEDTED